MYGHNQGYGFYLVIVGYRGYNSCTFLSTLWYEVYFFCAYTRICFNGILVAFSFSHSAFLKAGTAYDHPLYKLGKPSPTEVQQGNILAPEHLKEFSQSNTDDIHPLYGLSFHASRQVSFFFSCGFQEFFQIRPRLPPFPRLSVSCIRQPFPFWTQR